LKRYASNDIKMKKYNVNDLLQVMAKLRDPNTGCVWDKQQNYDSILPHTIEEVYEVAEAIKTKNFDELPGELGDLLFQIVFYSQIAKEEDRFQFEDVTHAITEKMIRRHPHVFSDHKIETVEEQSLLWDEIKKSEALEKVSNEVGALSGVNKFQPPINVARELQKKAAKVGFDWLTHEGPIDKLDEELVEVKEAIASGNIAAIKDELGDVFFAAVNLSRHLGIDPDDAISSTNRKFERRFNEMEKKAKENGQVFSELSLQEQEKYWVNVKSGEH